MVEPSAIQQSAIQQNAWLCRPSSSQSVRIVSMDIRAGTCTRNMSEPNTLSTRCTPEPQHQLLNPCVHCPLITCVAVVSAVVSKTIAVDNP